MATQTYLPPSFDQTDRLLKIKSFLPTLDAMYNECSEKNHLPGYAFGIMVDGRLIHSKGSGFIDLDKKIAATPQSMFRIASMTKSFTAMAILKLRDENKLRLDDPVHLYIPEIKNDFMKDASVITIRDLLTHSAGFPTDDPWGDRKLDETEEQLKALLKRGIFFSHVPGTSYEYSNLGYTLLGYIIKKVAGISCASYIQKMLPFNGIERDFTQVPPSKLAHGYRWVDNNWKEEPLLQDGIFGPMGGIIASVESFSRYAALHQLAWPPRQEKEAGPLKRSSIREMHQAWRFKELVLDKYSEGTDQFLTHAYGYGLYWIRDSQGRVFVGHSGGLPGFGSNWTILPEYGVGVILLANVTYAPAGKINLEVLNKLVEILNPRILPPSQILLERYNSLLKLLPDWENAEKSALFSSNFFLDYPIGQLKKETAEHFAKAGKILSYSDIIAENQLRGHFHIQCENSTVHISFSLTPENPPLIQQFQIKSL